jgi:hypothetical protein
MAFNDSRWTRQTLAFNSGRVVTDAGPENGPAIFTYASATDNIATVTAADYFAPVVYDLAVGDLIFIDASDADGIYLVSAVDRDLGTISVVSYGPAGAVATANIQAGAVTLAKLAAGITPSHVVKYAAQYTTTGGSASEAITVNGVLATDLVFIQVKNDGTNNRTVLAAAATLDTITVTFSGDPGADLVLYYQVLRAAV